MQLSPESGRPSPARRPHSPIHYRASELDAKTELLLHRIEPHLPTAEACVNFDDVFVPLAMEGRLALPDEPHVRGRRGVAVVFNRLLKLLDAGVLEQTQSKPCAPPAARPEPSRHARHHAPPTRVPRSQTRQLYCPRGTTSPRRQ